MSITRNERMYKVKSRVPRPDDAPVPLIRMSGKWLANAGFSPGRFLFAIVAEPGRVVLALIPKLKGVRQRKPRADRRDHQQHQGE